MIPAVYASIDDETETVYSVEIERRRVSPIDGSRRIYKKI